MAPAADDPDDPATDAPGSAPESTRPVPRTGVPVPGLTRLPVANLQPVIEGGAHPAKAVAGEVFPVTANVFREGHDAVAATVVLTSPDGREVRFRMRQIEPLGLDIWTADVAADTEGDWTLRVEAWSDVWGTWVHNAHAKLPVGVDVELVCLEGQHVLRRAADMAEDAGQTTDAIVLRSAAQAFLPDRPVRELLEITEAPSINRLMNDHVVRELVSPTLDYPLMVERQRALFSSWYEFFPRSQGAHRDDQGRWVSGTFDSSHERLEAAAAMGFDIVYLPPIHPIGKAFRKGRNNTLDPAPDDPGSPWAIGSAEGGHDAIHPELGDMESFDRFVARAHELGLEVALDFALQASPDHPWVTEHPEWFSTRLDGTIAYAENPPKKYQDIYPINFDNDPEGIHHEALRILRLWISHGVSVFRVDNPHTKPVSFWRWLLAEVRRTNPEVIFLAEAFTRPEMMAALGKVGFQQSYTYFTWRNEKWELEEYLGELSGAKAAYYRPSFWVNTPDINPTFLQSGSPSAFTIRAVLAATLSPSWGVYSGFELLEHRPLRVGGEEYLDSEKFEFRPRDFNAPGNLNMLLGKLNEIRREHPALQQLRHITFHHATNPQVICYSKRQGDDTVVVVCSLDPHNVVDSEIYLDMGALGAQPSDLLTVDDYLNWGSYTWGQRAFVRLSPQQPAHIFIVRH